MKLKITIQLIVFFIYCSNSNSQIVNTQFGQIQGAMNGNVFQFLGIPFAKPPVNTLRWKAPQNPDSWTNVLSTTNFPPVCPQKNFEQDGTTYTLEGNEDCLYLNIWTPQVTNPNLPVLVFIHGGGNQQGSSSEVNGGTQMFFGKNMAERGNAVIVTIQYRLGPLGFLVHPGLEAENTNNVSGNYAVLDQVLALQWVQNNIASFGGDASKVMIFGESAGGINLGNLLTTPLATGLFQRACIQSAVPLIDNYSNSESNGINYVNSFTTIGTDIDKINYMRTLTSDALVANESAPLSGGAVQSNWKAVVDGYVFNDFPFQNFQNGTFNKVPLIIGSNSEEMSLSAPATVYPSMVNLLINSIVPSALQPTAHSLYPSGTTNEEARESYVAILTDSQFTATTRRTAQCVSVNQNEPVWRYFFTYKHSIPALVPYGSYHGMELFFVFNNWENATLGSGSLFTANDAAVQDAMLDYWVNFANTGNPNGSGLESWPQYNGVTDCYLEINQNPNGVQCGLRTLESNLWDSTINFTPCTSSLGIDNTSLENNLIIYPNPMNESLVINLEIENNIQIEEIIIYDASGKLVRSTKNINSNSYTVQREKLGIGFYFLEIQTSDKNKEILKFVIR